MSPLREQDAILAIEPVLIFWFGDLAGKASVDLSKNALWWMGGVDTDAEVTERFGGLVQRALDGALRGWLESPRGSLALVLLLDQFTRMIGRGTPAAFAGDRAALEVCEAGIEAGHDRVLRFVERSFFYMPLMHAEDRAVARRSVAIYGELSALIVARADADHPDPLKHAVEHAEIIERFGRYPHRNQLLGRPSTEEERAYLAAGAPSFGQTKEP